MRNVSTYDKLTLTELRSELVAVTSSIAAAQEDLGTKLSNYHRDYLTAYAHSASSSVAGKNREAQYQHSEEGAVIINERAIINSLTLCRDLLIFMVTSRIPGNVPFPDVSLDDDGLVVV
jgi:hypothetical protein